MKAELRNCDVQRKANQHDRRRQKQSKHDAVNEPTMALGRLSRAVGLRHQRVQAKQQTHAEDRKGHVQ